jgi:hypothetical protein
VILGLSLKRNVAQVDFPIEEVVLPRVGELRRSLEEPVYWQVNLVVLQEAPKMKRLCQGWVLGENPTSYQRVPTPQAGKREGRRWRVVLVQTTRNVRITRGTTQGRSPGRLQAPERGPNEAAVVSRESFSLACLSVLSF